MNKNLIRELIKHKKSMLSLREVEDMSKPITKQLLLQDYYKNSNIIFTYVAFNQEVRTRELIVHALKEGKRVAVPKIINNQLEFIWINEISIYDKSSMGIDEPTEDMIVDVKELEEEAYILNIVPGLAFDQNKNRVGYGKGFYDRYFEKNNQIKFIKVAITFDFQIIDQIDSKEHDIKVDEIISQSYHIV